MIQCYLIIGQFIFVIELEHHGQVIKLEEMINAKEIILSGCSAGRLAIYYDIDVMKHIIHHVQ